MAKVRLSYKDFRPLQPGEAGYSKTKRSMISPSTGEIISRRQFVKNAERTGTSSTPASKGKTRKTRSDKGMTRGDYKLVKAETEARKEHKRRTLKLSKNTGLKRYESAKHRHIDKLNVERLKRSQQPLSYDYIPEEDSFYDLYDVIKHPDDYNDEQIDDAMSYFWGDDYDEEYDYDYPLGETP